MEYKVVIGENITKLVEEVNDLMDQGWQCQGGIVCVFGRRFYQAMVRRLR